MMDAQIAAKLRTHARPLSDARADLDALLEQVGSARYVLLGEASHGTHEFYALRATLTQRLVEEAGFSVIAVEADWPDAHRVDRFVRGTGGDADAAQALSDFERFPRWMWRNTVVRELATWLRAHDRASAEPAGFYGIDLYSMQASMQAVLTYLDGVDPEGARRARQRYACFDSFGGDPQQYGYATTQGHLPTCEDAVVEQLVALHERRTELLARDGLSARDEHFFAVQNARVVRNAERYYRAMYRGGIASWNLRDTHMADTVDALCNHLGAREPRAKVIVWAHNSHLGDARATELGEHGELNLGQLLRERHPGETFVIGFSTYEGTVTAASAWDGPGQRKRVRPALRGSHEALLHSVGIPSFWLPLRDPRVRGALEEPRLQRAIGVVYRPETERASHYYHTRLPGQFDAVVHVDRTHALEPLDGHAAVASDEPPETYPTGL